MHLRQLAFLIPLLTTVLAQAQLATVVYDPERRTLNEGQPLPAETRWMLTGPVAERMTLAELQLFDRKDQKRLLFTGRWEQSEWSNEPRFLRTIGTRSRKCDALTISNAVNLRRDSFNVLGIMILTMQNDQVFESTANE